MWKSSFFRWECTDKHRFPRLLALSINTLVLILICMAWGSSAKAAEKIKVVTAQWQNFTNPDLSGVYFDYLRLVLPADQYQYEVEFTTFGRSLAALKKHQADISFGLTGTDAPNSLRAAIPYDVDRVIAIYSPQQLGISSLTSLSTQSLTSYRLAWNLAYNYGEALGLKSQGYQVTSSEQGITLVINQRIDIYLAESGDLNSEDSLKLLQHPKLQQEELLQIPVYVGFSNTARGKSLKQKWDERVKLLLADGQLAEFYRKNPSIRIPQ